MITKLQEVKKQIRNDWYDYEEELFKKTFNTNFIALKIDLTRSINEITGQMNFNKKILYDLENLVSFQNNSNGILMTINQHSWLGRNLNYFNNEFPVFFLYTNKDFVDGASLKGQYAYYVGTYKYSNILGSQKTIYAFKEFDFDEFNKKNPNFIFYPEEKTVYELHEGMDYLIKIIKKHKDLFNPVILENLLKNNMSK